MSIVSGFLFNKRLGQNFILDEVFLEHIVAELDLAPDETVVEVGTGAGTLTRVLARKVKRVVTFEVDGRLRQLLWKQFAEFKNIQLRLENALRADMPAGKYSVVANIPYYITTPLIWRFMADVNCTRICVLVAEDVARRIAADPGGKDYGALTVGIRAQADCRIIRHVPRACFVPEPNVDSAFVVIEKRRGAAKISDAFLKKIFSARRKTILNALGGNKEIARNILTAVGIPESARPEQIAPDKFIQLSAKLAETLAWKSAIS